jgi:hypothetical protein
MKKAILPAIWIVALGVAGTVGYMLIELTRSGRVVAHATSIERLPARQPHNPRSRWSVTEHLSAHHVLIAHVETHFLNEALAIAQQIVEPTPPVYAEILIYFHRPGRPDTLPPRRVQWTKRSGYVETIYASDAAQ